jgi:YHS domain-containing protein
VNIHLNRRLSIVVILAITGIGSVACAQDIDLKNIKCVVDDKPASSKYVVPFNYAKVFLSTPKAAALMEADNKKRSKGKYVAKANHQLALTKQYHQTKCCVGEDAPLSDDIATDIEGVTVKFCCKSCKALVDEEKDPEAKLQMVFGYREFRKGFEKTVSPYFQEDLKCFIMPEKSVKNKYTLDHNGGTAFLCCSSCVKRIDRDPEKYNAGLNHQLVQTGQFKQTTCPITGGKTNDEMAIEIEGVSIKFSDQASRDKVKNLADEQAVVDLIFNNTQFKKSFAKK